MTTPFEMNPQKDADKPASWIGNIKEQLEPVFLILQVNSVSQRRISYELFQTALVQKTTLPKHFSPNKLICDSNVSTSPEIVSIRHFSSRRIF